MSCSTNDTQEDLLLPRLSAHPEMLVNLCDFKVSIVTHEFDP